MRVQLCVVLLFRSFLMLWCFWLCGVCTGCCVCVHAWVCAEAHAAAVAAKSGIEAVVAAMRRHTGVVGVAEHGCAALKNIAWPGGCGAAVCTCVQGRERNSERQ